MILLSAFIAPSLFCKQAELITFIYKFKVIMYCITLQHATMSLKSSVVHDLAFQ